MEKFVVSCISVFLLVGIIYSIQLANGDLGTMKQEDNALIEEKIDNDIQVNNRAMHHILGENNYTENTLLKSSLIIKSKSNQDITFEYEVGNIGGNSIRLDFTSDQTYEYELHNKSTGERIRYSEEETFREGRKTIELSPNQTLSYQVKFSQLEYGDYVFSMWITAVDGISTLKSISFSVKE
ncbi:BsuPI-related putative proteinase inhibitor [Bacillus sinesaloumensis]|uniref:BsuPI-related putative proteinase inhibitor n=1 Tax=Litchfieldia sinesaloumensis TaxID=1926280 RepID=UPI0009886D7E|nr:BsuPI-related putative proteinase inhibitor [Bacillus sinesaloumensis]